MSEEEKMLQRERTLLFMIDADEETSKFWIACQQS